MEGDTRVSSVRARKVFTADNDSKGDGHKGWYVKLHFGTGDDRFVRVRRR
jgi:hypothetical protein